MARPTSEYPTDLELEILKLLWQSEPQVVEDVRSALAKAGRNLTYSSVITVMNIMVRKGYLERKKQGRAFEFRPMVVEQDINRGMLNDIVDRVFDGSATAVMLALLESSEVDDAELSQIRRLIQRKSKESKS